MSMTNQITLAGSDFKLLPARICGKVTPGLFSIFVDGENKQRTVAYDAYEKTFWCSYLRRKFKSLRDFLQAAFDIPLTINDDIGKPSPCGEESKQARQGTKESPEQVWDEASVSKLLLDSERANIKAVVALYNSQTERQKRGLSEGKRTGRGFSRVDRPTGNRLAKAIISRKRLSQSDINACKRIAHKYRKQLVKIANAK